jgi:hypothetical protein
MLLAMASAANFLFSKELELDAEDMTKTFLSSRA